MPGEFISPIVKDKDLSVIPTYPETKFHCSPVHNYVAFSQTPETTILSVGDGFTIQQDRNADGHKVNTHTITARAKSHEALWGYTAVKGDQSYRVAFMSEHDNNPPTSFGHGDGQPQHYASDKAPVEVTRITHIPPEKLNAPYTFTETPLKTTYGSLKQDKEIKFAINAALVEARKQSEALRAQGAIITDNNFDRFQPNGIPESVARIASDLVADYETLVSPLPAEPLRES